MKLLSLLLVATALPGAQFDQLEWRSLGPAIMGGRISDIAGVAGDAAKVYAASGSGGLFRSDNGGVTWQSIFDHEGTISIGALAIGQNDPNLVWVGTGESNVRNSVSFGDGVYRSTDGGAHWKKMGLGDTETIARIVIDPHDDKHVLVAVVGHPFGPNAERGVFVTSDGGETWRKTLYLDDSHGAVGLEMGANDSRKVFAGLWHFDRKPWTYTSGDEKGGVFVSSDGGEHWNKITKGLPALLGRVSVKVSPAKPSEVYVIAESKEGTLFRSHDGGASFEKVSDDRELVGRAYYFTDMRIAPDDADHIFVLADALMESRDGGKSFKRASPRVHGDLHALWIDPKDTRRMWQGSDGGLAVTYDAGRTWEQVNNLPLAQLYHVSADAQEPFYGVMVGMQDNGAWAGPSRTHEPGGIFNDDWRMLGPFTGFNALTVPDDPDVIIHEQPGGGLLRTNTRTHEQQVISPQPRSYGGAPASEMKYRFNWDAPLERSHFGKDTIYLAGNLVFQSSDGGKSWETISRDLTKHEASRLGNIGGPISIDNSASETYATITTLAESEAKRNVIWVGTDDGNVQFTQNGGGSWTDVSRGLPEGSPISHVEASHTNAGTAYVSVDRHMFDDMRPYIFRTMDAGKSWEKISSGLPEKAFVWIVREDPREANLLYAGTELGLYASFDKGASWKPLHLKNMPEAIAVRDIVIEPKSGDLLVATHGRGVFLLDDASCLAEFAKDSTARLLPIRRALRFSVRGTRFGYGDKVFTASNPEYGALFTFISATEGPVKIEVADAEGKTVRRVDVMAHSGLNRATWDLRYGTRGPQAVPGEYKARLGTSEQKFRVELDPQVHSSAGDLQQQFEMLQEIGKMQRQIAELAKGDAAPFSRPAGSSRSATGPRLRENLATLFQAVDGADAAPTEAQSKYFDELQQEFKQMMQQLKAR